MERLEIINDIAKLFELHGVETCNQIIEDEMDKVEQYALEKSSSEGFWNIIKHSPFYWDKIILNDEIISLPPCQIFNFTYETDKGLTGALVSDYRTGPPDTIELYMEAVPDNVLENVLKILENKLKYEN